MWIKQDNELTFTASNIAALQIIPNGNWLLKFSPTKGFFLEQAPDFKFPKKIYGDSELIAKRYLNTFGNQTSNLGVLLTGMKGTGKSVTAKITCAKSDRPVILITEPFTGDGFKSFLSNITQEVIIFIDEFEKVYYDTHLQNSFLSILDGIFEGKKMFIFTSNEKGKINQYMINRPGRVHYLREYDALDDSIINDVIDDNLELKENKAGLIEVLNILSNVTMDMLISLIKEMNLYKESARESIVFLNLKPDKTNYDVEVYQDNLKLGSTTIGHHPLTSDSITFEIYASDASKYKRGATNHTSIMAQLNHKKKSKKIALGAQMPGVETEIYPSDEKASYPTGEKESYSEDSESNYAESDLMKTEEVFDSEGIEGESLWVNFNISVADSKIEQSGKTIIIVDKYGTRFTFNKAKYYSFSF